MSNFYVITNVKTGNVVEQGFATKQEAKAKRDELNKPVWDKANKKDDKAQKFFEYIVTKGEEHPRYND
jgi:hypothetical protein